MYVILIRMARVAGVNDAESNNVANNKYEYTYASYVYLYVLYL